MRPALGLFILAFAAAPALSAAPLPPRRPPDLTPAPPPAPAAQPSGQPSGGQPAGAPALAPAGRQPVDIDPEKLQPFNLPPASRQRMRECGEEWRALKLAGHARGLTWRAFAETCLPR